MQRALRRGASRLLTALPPTPGAMDGALWQSPPLPLPEGHSLAEIEEVFRSWSVNGQPVGHLDGYVDDSLWRFLYTWGLVRDLSGSCLELGANPYFTTHLLDEHTSLDLTLANYYGERGEATETVSYLPTGSTERVEKARCSTLFNVEEDTFPYDDDHFDVVLFCEMIEHMLMDPLHTLREIRRVLKPGGVLVLTTPNVARLNNVMAVLNGANLYDPYSGFGPYGRHNREYTRDELHRVLAFTGYDVDESLTADGHPTTAAHWPHHAEVAPLLQGRRPDLGHYLFVRARATGVPRDGLPSFLFRSWPTDVLVDDA